MNLNVHNIIDQVKDGKQRPRGREPRLIVVHRTGVNRDIGLDLGDDPVALCAHYSGRDTTYPEIARTTGGELAYTLMVTRAPRLYQCLPLWEVGAHARRWNVDAYGVGVVGDFRYDLPTPEQWNLTRTAVAFLAIGMEIPTAQIYGHDELDGASRDPSKQCPGDQWDMDRFRAGVNELRGIWGREMIRELGLV